MLNAILSHISFSSTPLLEQPLPAVLNQLVNEFSQRMKQQTTTGDGIDKFSDSAQKKVQQETASQRQVGVVCVCVCVCARACCVCVCVCVIW